MHKSKLAGFIIDCRTSDLDAAARFWSQALGMSRADLDAETGTPYRRLIDSQHGLAVEVQQVDHESRVHLDIETDDVEAEVSRLERLGAKRVRQIRTWWVMEAPTGQRLSVVRATGSEFEGRANCWT